MDRQPRSVQDQMFSSNPFLELAPRAMSLCSGKLKLALAKTCARLAHTTLLILDGSSFRNGAQPGNHIAQTWVSTTCSPKSIGLILLAREIGVRVEACSSFSPEREVCKKHLGVTTILGSNIARAFCHPVCEVLQSGSNYT